MSNRRFWVATKATTGKKEKRNNRKEKPKYDKKKPYILKEEAFERNYVIADCCKPIPGDESLGFINDDGNVVVPTNSCPIAMRLKKQLWRTHPEHGMEHITLHSRRRLRLRGFD